MIYDRWFYECFNKTVTFFIEFLTFYPRGGVLFEGGGIGLILNPKNIYIYTV